MKMNILQWAPVLVTALFIVGIVTGCGTDEHKDSHADSTGAHGRDSAHGDHHATAADAAKAHTHSTRLEFSSEPARIAAGKPATLTLKIVDATSGAPVQEFDTVHEKVLHLIIVSRDLGWFNHVHPEYKGDGTFIISTSFPRDGHYKLYADYTPRGKEHEVAMHEFATAGAPASPAAPQLQADSLGGEMWITRRVTSIPEGFPEATGGGSYEVALMPMPGTIVAGQDVMLHFQVRDAAGKPLPAVEPYLGAMGHCVILSSDAVTYLHTHPMEGGGDHQHHGAPAVSDSAKAPSSKGTEKKSDVIFHTNFPSPGLYKVWGQFQHKGKIVTAPFVLRVNPAS